MKLLPILASALAVADFAAGVPTSTDANKSSNSNKNNNSTVDKNYLLIIKDGNSNKNKNYLLTIEDSNSTLKNNDNDTLINKDSNGTNGTIEDSESEMRSKRAELEDPIPGHVQINDTEAERFVANNSILRTAQGMPLPMPLPKDVFNEFKCIGSNHKNSPRMSLQFKGYCEEEYGRCFLRALREYGTLVHNWQCWKRDDGWWQVDYTHLLGDSYLGLPRGSDPVLNAALAQVIGYDPHCTLK
ncbi:unnamed protein product [Clonostachys byssicola]|uniref:Uncharacterized protein n=1 Tax=Clonostachys byssicola TaxID=160290 RepID=A0A9N9Y458_9HYPO|nr:unnamed protein product [Clonostachys byssicola]